MAANVRSDFAKGNIKDGYDYMMDVYDQQTEIWPQLFETKKVDGSFWQRTSVVNNGTWRKTSDNEGFQARAIVEGYTAYAAVFDYTDAVSFSNDTVKDHQKVKDLLKTTAEGWGKTGPKTREEFYATVFNEGGYTAGSWIFNGSVTNVVSDPSGDGVYDGTTASPVPAFNLSSSTRTSKGGASYYNGYSATNLTPDNLKTVYLHMKSVNNREENDTIMSLPVDTLLVPGALALTGAEILDSTLKAWDSTNTTNVMAGKLNLVVWDYLTDTDAWFLGCKKQGIQALDRQAPQIDFFQDKKNRCWWATVEMRIGVLFWNWRFWSGSNFATS